MQNDQQNETVSAEAEEGRLVSPEEAAEQLKKAGSDRLHVQLKDGVVNPIELARAIGVRPQMIYNYIRTGKISAVRQNNTQKLFIPEAVAYDFASKYLSRKAKKQNEIEAQLAGIEVSR